MVKLGGKGMDLVGRGRVASAFMYKSFLTNGFSLALRVLTISMCSIVDSFAHRSGKLESRA